VFDLPGCIDVFQHTLRITIELRRGVRVIGWVDALERSVMLQTRALVDSAQCEYWCRAASLVVARVARQGIYAGDVLRLAVFVRHV
jgi:hypothetical protein